MSPPRFIVFEGPDGAGKTTCAGLLAQRLGADLLTTPSPGVRRYRDDLLHHLGSGQEAHQLFYLATVFAASETAAAALARGRSVVLDRYFLSTQAYAAFRGTGLDLDDLGRHLTPACATVYLDPPLAVRQARLRRRPTTLADRETVPSAADHRLRQEHLRRTHLPVVGRLLHLTTAERTPTALIDEIVAWLEL